MDTNEKITLAIVVALLGSYGYMVGGIGGVIFALFIAYPAALMMPSVWQLLTEIFRDFAFIVVIAVLVIAFWGVKG